ncbi:MAG: hypothetical protein JNL74_21965 [Fibrobacteres bacterium]|nr:hypothetical protein [Fibrobacterota bacterium]
MQKPVALLILILVSLAAAGGTSNVLDLMPKSVRQMGLSGIKSATLLSGSRGTYEASTTTLNGKYDFTTMQAKLPFGDDFYFAGAGVALSGRITARAYWAQISGGDVELTSNIDSITDADTIAYKVDNRISYSDNIATLLFQAELLDSFFTGITIKWIKSGKDSFQTDVASLDIGASFPMFFKNVSAAFLFRNAVTLGLNSKSRDETAAQELRTAFSFTALSGKAALYTELGITMSEKLMYEPVLGLEWNLNRFLDVRSGISYQSGSRRPDFAGGFSLNVGGFYLDYALVSKSDLGFEGGHRISAGYTIGIDYD